MYQADIFGLQGRNLAPNDQLALSSSCGPTADELSANATVMIPEEMRPLYPTEHTLTVVAGPHADESVLTEEGLRMFFETRWKVRSYCCFRSTPSVPSSVFCSQKRNYCRRYVARIMSSYTGQPIKQPNGHSSRRSKVRLGEERRRDGREPPQ